MLMCSYNTRRLGGGYGIEAGNTGKDGNGGFSVGAGGGGGGGGELWRG